MYSNCDYTAPNDYRNYLAHHGVKGMKWGIRRYQDDNGSLTSAGRKRYLDASGDKAYKRLTKDIRKKRTKMYGILSSYRFGIGKNSQKAIRNYDKVNKKPKALREWEKKYNALMDQADEAWGDKNYDLGRKIDAKLDIMEKNMPAWEFVDTDVTMDYLRDLGFNEDASNEIYDKLRREGKLMTRLGDL